jgi:hypothetical protein
VIRHLRDSSKALIAQMHALEEIDGDEDDG